MHFTWNKLKYIIYIIIYIILRRNSCHIVTSSNFNLIHVHGWDIQRQRDTFQWKDRPDKSRERYSGRLVWQEENIVLETLWQECHADPESGDQGVKVIRKLHVVGENYSQWPQGRLCVSGVHANTCYLIPVMELKSAMAAAVPQCSKATVLKMWYLTIRKWLETQILSLFFSSPEPVSRRAFRWSPSDCFRELPRQICGTGKAMALPIFGNPISPEKEPGQQHTALTGQQFVGPLGIWLKLTSPTKDKISFVLLQKNKKSSIYLKLTQQDRE